MRALLSVFYKDGLVEFAGDLIALGWELVSSGGTSTALAEADIPHLQVDEVTGYPEMPGGRVKTLHPAIHGGILADRDVPAQMDWLKEQGIEAFDLVVCNLYPFSSNPSIELIDVGGPTMVRAAAKNHSSVGVIVRPADYGTVITELKASGELSNATRLRLASQAFAHTASYDAGISNWFARQLMEEGGMPATYHLGLNLSAAGRYGENPHQQGGLYLRDGEPSWWEQTVQLGGKAMSYLNFYDAAAAWKLVNALGSRPAVVVIKHANPCGAALADDITQAYRLAHECDPDSAFGGIVAVSQMVPLALAEALQGIFTEVIIAPGFEPDALALLRAKKKDLRIFQAPSPASDDLETRSISGGVLMQTVDPVAIDRSRWQVVSKAQPTAQQWSDLELAYRLAAASTSNSIALVHKSQAVGIGVGQQNRRDAAAIATTKANGRARGGAGASEAFFPFRDGLDSVAASGVGAIVEPGGSKRDDEVIAAADEHGIALVFTGERHFRH